MSRPGDWNCRSCQHLNFQRRDSCQRCGESRSGDFGGYGGRVGSSFGFTTGSDVRPGDWYCTAGNCGTHNFANRSSCFKCGAFKDDSAGGFDCDIPRSRAFGVIDPDGNLATGYVPGKDAMSTILLAGWNVSDAVPQGTLTTELHTKNMLSIFGCCNQLRETEMRE